MPFAGSEAVLSNLIFVNLSATVGGSDPAALANLRSTADALAKAIVAWIAIASVNSINGQVLPGVSVATAGSPAAQTGATVAPGLIAPGNSLI